MSAFPSVESINPTTDSATGGAATSGSTAATSHSVVLPATISPGSFLMICGRIAVAGTVAITGGGWTITQDATDGSDDVTFWAYRDTLADGSEDSTSVTVTHGNGKMTAVSLSVVGAADPSERPPGSSTVATANSTTPQPNSGSAPWGVSDNLWFFFAGWEGEQTLSKSPPTNYTDRADVSSGTGGAVASNCQIKCCDRQLTSGGETPGSITISSADDWTAWTIVVGPALPIPLVTMAPMMPAGAY